MHDVSDLLPGVFLNASQVWRECRSGTIEPDTVGIHFAGLYGLPLAAANLIRYLAALNKHEMLPWDVWGAQPQPTASLSNNQLALS